SAGAVTGIVIQNQGSGYTSAPTVPAMPAPANAGTTATATGVLGANFVGPSIGSPSFANGITVAGVVGSGLAVPVGTGSAASPSSANTLVPIVGVTAAPSLNQLAGTSQTVQAIAVALGPAQTTAVPGNAGFEPPALVNIPLDVVATPSSASVNPAGIV